VPYVVQKLQNRLLNRRSLLKTVAKEKKALSRLMVPPGDACGLGVVSAAV
jgi:hypothetical protein